MNISEELRDKAISLGLCHKWQKAWATNTNKDELVEMYKRGLDFCIENNFPSNEYMIKHFSGVMQRHGVYVSERVYGLNGKDEILNGNCEAFLTYDNYAVGNIYVRHDSYAKITAKDNSKVFVSCYDNSKLELKTEGNGSITVYNYGYKSINHIGNVLIRDKK